MVSGSNKNDRKLYREVLISETLYKIICKYKEHGINGLIQKLKSSYSGDFKQNVIEYMHSNHLSLTETAVSREESAQVTDASLADTAIRLVDGTAPTKDANTPIVNTEPKVGRNDPCPCGSGKKYKNCCGKNT